MPSDSESGLILTRATIWLALICYVLAQLLHSSLRIRCGIVDRSRRIRFGSWVHLLGALIYLAHVVCAFQFHHHWSHDDAVLATARQTAAVTGWNWGGGLWVNYTFSLLWIAHAVNSLRRHPRLGVWEWCVRGTFLFMIFNGAILFARPAVRPAGIVLCALLLTAWWPRQPLVQQGGLQ